jgi:hypothetical protein
LLNGSKRMANSVQATDLEQLKCHQAANCCHAIEVFLGSCSTLGISCRCAAMMDWIAMTAVVLVAHLGFPVAQSESTLSSERVASDFIG